MLAKFSNAPPPGLPSIPPPPPHPQKGCKGAAGSSATLPPNFIGNLQLCLPLSAGHRMGWRRGCGQEEQGEETGKEGEKAGREGERQEGREGTSRRMKGERHKERKLRNGCTRRKKVSGHSTGGVWKEVGRKERTGNSQRKDEVNKRRMKKIIMEGKEGEIA